MRRCRLPFRNPAESGWGCGYGDGSGALLAPTATWLGEPVALGRRALDMVIAPYWFNGTWVFDDPMVGLKREPFVAGVPEMIDVLAKEIPDA